MASSVCRSFAHHDVSVQSDGLTCIAGGVATEDESLHPQRAGRVELQQLGHLVLRRRLGRRGSVSQVDDSAHVIVRCMLDFVGLCASLEARSRDFRLVAEVAFVYTGKTKATSVITTS